MMKTLFWKTLLSSGCLLAAVCTAGAGPLERGAVIGEPVWVLHVDVDALRSTTGGQFALAQSEKPEVQKKLAAFQAIFNFDPRQAVHGVTLYGGSKAPDDGVLLVYADFDSARLTTLAEGAKEHRASTHRLHQIHSWLEERRPAKDGVKPRTYAAIHAGRLVVFGQKEERVAEALDVLDGFKPGLNTSQQFAHLGGVGAGFVQAAARNLDLPGSAPGAVVLKQSKSMALNVAEAQGQMLATLTLEADTAEIAQQIASIGRGIIGLMALQTEKPESVKLAQGLSIQENGASVVVNLTLPAQEMLGIIHNKAKAAKRASGL
jgi:hypothetical protein